MKFYSVVKYTLTVLFIAILVFAAVNMESSDAPQVAPQHPQSKFNM